VTHSGDATGSYRYHALFGELLRRAFATTIP